MTILIADDNPGDVAHLKKLFEESDLLNPFQVVVNGSETIAYLASSEPFNDRLLFPFPTLLFLDLVMPGKSGLDVLRWIQNQNYRLGVIIMTGIGNLHEVRIGYELGADSFLVKPIVKADFLNLIQTHSNFRIEQTSSGRQLRFVT